MKIERNVFDWNRHSIAGDGKSGSGYIAEDNLVLQHGGVHFRCVQPSRTDLVALVLSPFILAADAYLVAEALDSDWIYHTHTIDMHGVGTCDAGILGDHNCGRAGSSWTSATTPVSGLTS